MNIGKFHFLQSLAERMETSGSARAVFGDPVTVGEKVIIPVARIAYGLGGGYGSVGSRKGEDELPGGEGGGGGIVAAPVGVYEVTADATRFVPTGRPWLQMGALLLLGIAVGGLLVKERHR